MTLVCRPVGRGNWAPITVVITGRRVAPLLIRRNERFTLGGVLYRICRVSP